ncbi:hypothetical protein V8G54_027685, partial [Vigna mungo]
RVQSSPTSKDIQNSFPLTTAKKIPFDYQRTQPTKYQRRQPKNSPFGEKMTMLALIGTSSQYFQYFYGGTEMKAFNEGNETVQCQPLRWRRHSSESWTISFAFVSRESLPSCRERGS